MCLTRRLSMGSGYSEAQAYAPPAAGSYRDMLMGAAGQVPGGPAGQLARAHSHQLQAGLGLQQHPDPQQLLLQAGQQGGANGWGAVNGTTASSAAQHAQPEQASGAAGAGAPEQQLTRVAAAMRDGRSGAAEEGRGGNAADEAGGQARGGAAALQQQQSWQSFALSVQQASAGLGGAALREGVRGLHAVHAALEQPQQQQQAPPLLQALAAPSLVAPSLVAQAQWQALQAQAQQAAQQQFEAQQQQHLQQQQQLHAAQLLLLQQQQQYQQLEAVPEGLPHPSAPSNGALFSLAEPCDCSLLG